jgi:uncharacterized protein (TIGR02145 family)
MSYQAVIRNASEQLVTTQVGMQISLIQGNVDGTVVYSETQTPTPNINGLVTIEIGGEAGFDAINWADGPYFIKIETDPAGGTNYTITGTSQLLSVPYALFANNLSLSKDNISYSFYIRDNKSLMVLPRIEVEKPYSLVPTVIDADDNTYATVKIGEQVWMAENLKTTHLKDNTPIPLVTESSDWKALTTPAYCWYNNDETTNKNIYGALYNWYTVNTNKLCPMGWHVPTDEELTTLTTYLGLLAGGRLKESGTTHWGSTNIDAINDSKFIALPGGIRWDGSFYSIGIAGWWWSSTQYDTSIAWLKGLSNDAAEVNSTNFDKQSGASVRCLLDL